jgi:16S rRNA (guanine527-N7)-methyltransferase
MKNKQIFTKFLEDHHFQREKVVKFENYLLLLLDWNKKINLISRKTERDEYWLKHFLDSLLPIEEIDFSNKTILDFGTGGGLPGIPIKLLYPNCKMYLLESRRKKADAVKNIVKVLDAKQCFTIVSRLEEMDENWYGKFDYIVCRSVKILPEYKEKLFKLIKSGGKVILYKSRLLDDVEQFPNKKTYDLSHPEIGTRKIIEITK